MRKKSKLIRRLSACLCLALSAWMIFSPSAMAVRALPETLRLSVGQTYSLPLGVAVLSGTDERLLSAEGAALEGVETGETEVSLNLFGLLPLKKFQVRVSEQVTLMPGGQAVGVALRTGGVLIVGLSDIAGQNPAKNAGLRAGDIILSLNSQAVKSSKELTDYVSASNGNKLTVLYERDGEKRETTLSPVSQDEAWRLGVWVRDSTAGVGTLSYYHPATHVYGALGHAISDPDTGLVMPVRVGQLFKAQIVDVRKGERGTPGELRGSFLLDQVTLGDIKKNTIYGIYGTAEEEIKNPLYPDGLPIALKESVHTGKASILSTIAGEEMKEYEIEIVSVANQSRPSQKSMVLHVTDEDLIKKTGGIVQGMSGSPIIQDGRIVGAVTHVFVDDPTRGYGIFIEWMLETSEDVALENSADSISDAA